MIGLSLVAVKLLSNDTVPSLNLLGTCQQIG